MGMYDTVEVKCPECQKPQEAQSKGGECMLAHYTLEDCPLDVLGDVNRHGPFVCDCGVKFEVQKIPVSFRFGTVKI